MIARDLLRSGRWREHRQHVVFEQWREVVGEWLRRVEPPELRDLGGGKRFPVEWVLEHGALKRQPWLVGRIGREDAKRRQLVRAEFKAELLGALPDRGLSGGFPGLGLAAGEHESRRSCLADGEDASMRIPQYHGTDNEVGGVVGVSITGDSRHGGHGATARR